MTNITVYFKKQFDNEGRCKYRFLFLFFFTICFYLQLDCNFALPVTVFCVCRA